MAHEFNGSYTNENLAHVSFPLGGLGAGMICLEGTGSLGSFSLENKPDVGNSPNIFAALHVNGVFRVLEGQVPGHKIFGPDRGNGLTGKNYGLPRFGECEFLGRFPFAEIALADEDIPFDVRLTGWSPFSPGNDFISSLPFGVLDYSFENSGDSEQSAVFYLQCAQFLGEGAEIVPVSSGFLLRRPDTAEKPGCSFSVFATESACIDTAWFRGGWWDAFTMAVNGMEKGESTSKVLDDPTTARGAALSVPFSLKPGESRNIRLILSWFAPSSDVAAGKAPDAEDKPDCGCGCDCGQESERAYSPWYVGQFADIFKLNAYIKENIASMEAESRLFSRALFASEIPPSALEAVAANLSILKSPTMLRLKDGRIWGWEGCHSSGGCCHGSCTHVFNYAQAICHLFPALERGLRKTEFFDGQREDGHQQFRANLPISPAPHDFHSASDGQLGGIVKVYRDWLISGDDAWLAEFYPKVKQSLLYCIKTWDPGEAGVLTEMHHNTYDIEFYGTDIMCTGFYLAALKAASVMAKAQNDGDGQHFESLYEKGRRYAETRLFNGDFFIQENDLAGLVNPPRCDGREAPEEKALFAKEGPKYQYGTGCISDGVIGPWLAKLSGLGDILDPEMVKSHLMSIFRHNFKSDLSKHVNPQRPGYAVGKEGGLLLCSWPNGGKPSLPFVYSDEVWTGIEYEVASYLITEGFTEEGLRIVEAARQRYDGRIRNPYNEYECGHWYARAMASYALLAAFSGARYDRLSGQMEFRPRIQGDFKCFFAGEDGFGLVGMRDGEPFYEDVKGRVKIDSWA